jgi:hypothetical protein
MSLWTSVQKNIFQGVDAQAGRGGDIKRLNRFHARFLSKQSRNAPGKHA